MGVTVGISESTNITAMKTRIAKLTFDSSYPTDGEPLTPASFGLDYIAFIIAEPSGGYVFQYDYANSKIKAFWVDTTVDGAALAEVVDTTSLATVTTRVLAFGR